MKKIIMSLLLTISVMLSAEQTLTVIDFTIDTNEKNHQNLGKGIAEYLATEIRQNLNLTVTGRDMRNGLLSNAGLSENDTPEVLSSALGTDYIVTAHITDENGQLSIQATLYGTAVKEILADYQAESSLSNFKELTHEITAGIGLTLTGDEPKERIWPRLQNARFLLCLSDGLSYYDRGDRKHAYNELRKALSANRGDETAGNFLEKINVSAVRLSGKNSPFAGPVNPTYGSLYGQNALYLRIGTSGVAGVLPEEETSFGSLNNEADFRLGYNHAFDNRFSLLLEGSSVVFPYDQTYWGGTAGLAVPMTEKSSLGISFSFYTPQGHLPDSDGDGEADGISVYEKTTGNMPSNGYILTPSFGTMLLDDRLTIDASLAIPFDIPRVYRLESDDYLVGDQPLQLSGTTDFWIFKNRLSLGMDFSADLYSDDSYNGLVLEENPVLLFWLAKPKGNSGLALKGGISGIQDLAAATPGFYMGCHGGLTVMLLGFTGDVSFELKDKDLADYRGNGEIISLLSFNITISRISF